ncbi:uncharacterized protein LOC126865269 [Bombus huntii]|uniref:uncharacterized protein LOC126865269 n=1 Tax=Bombus huntii TaxID=85661 RepID=UPI0021AAA2E2|nr:uncharacterized protein LOC126865269 [Bombus huntii]
MLGNFRTRSRYSLGSYVLNGRSWPSSKIPNASLAFARNFTATPALSKDSEKIVRLSEGLTRRLWQEQARFFRNDCILMGKAHGKRPPRPPSKLSSKSVPDCSKGQSSRRRSCRQSYQRQKPCIPQDKCVPPAPPCSRPRPKNPKCPQPETPCPPPCPMPCEKPAEEKHLPPKICYRRCPLPPRPPKPPKCPRCPAPLPPPPPPKVPRPPKCPPPCPPPPAPPPPRCPKVPKCPECPPQRECPPPPPCEPCPCPPPCPPAYCPPPPPCPPCPPPIPCPRPLPCPPPPPPRICPPCPPCAECPKPPPCPPPPSCSPCPCPKPPPPCPCPKPCPPCQQVAKPRVSCPKDVPSCPKNSGKNPRKRNRNKPKKRGMSTYHAVSRFAPLSIDYRRFHVDSTLLGSSDESRKSTAKPPSCKDLEDICEDKRRSCVKPCEKKPEKKKKKKDVCAGRKPVKLREKKKEKQDECDDRCLPKGKCEVPEIAKPPKMEYGPTTCPAPKFVSPKPCPEIPEAKYEVESCVEVRTSGKAKKEICVPPPLPEPPTDPVILCPCPPPPKMHPGPCPCYDLKAVKPSKPTLPPCPHKEKYVCCKDPFYCPPEKLECKRRKPCDPKKMKKRKERRDK